MRYGMCLPAGHAPESRFPALAEGRDSGSIRFVDCVTPT